MRKGKGAHKVLGGGGMVNSTGEDLQKQKEKKKNKNQCCKVQTPRVNAEGENAQKIIPRHQLRRGRAKKNHEGGGGIDKNHKGGGRGVPRA